MPPNIFCLFFIWVSDVRAIHLQKAYNRIRKSIWSSLGWGHHSRVNTHFMHGIRKKRETNLELTFHNCILKNTAANSWLKFYRSLIHTGRNYPKFKIVIFVVLNFENLTILGTFIDKFVHWKKISKHLAKLTAIKRKFSKISWIS